MFTVAAKNVSYQQRPPPHIQRSVFVMGRSGFHKPLRSIIGILIDDLQVWYNARTGLSFMNDANINRIFDNAVDRGVGKIFPVRFENPLLLE